MMITLVAIADADKKLAEDERIREMCPVGSKGFVYKTVRMIMNRCETHWAKKT